MRCIVALVFSVSAAGLLPGCVADHASAIDESDTRAEFVSQLPDKPANPEDPYGSCGDETAGEEGWSVCSIPGLGCGGWGDIGACSDGVCEYMHLWLTCQHRCEHASDCPMPGTGDAAPECNLDACILPCDEDTVCPDGFTCANVSQTGAEHDEFGWICMEYRAFEPYVLIP